VSRTLSKWQREKVVSRISGYYCLEDEPTLRRLAGEAAEEA